MAVSYSNYPRPQPRPSHIKTDHDKNSNYFGAFKVPHSVEFQKENILLNIQVKAWGAFQKSVKSDHGFLLEQGGGVKFDIEGLEWR